MSDIIQKLQEEGILREIHPATGAYIDYLNELLKDNVLPPKVKLSHYLNPKDKSVVLTYEVEEPLTADIEEKVKVVWPQVISEYHSRLSQFNARRK